ncbi:hypothetical protein Cgig2_001343 [Carnegiea gigantea]|uniref:Uncharacterized protein n=1 Tax=Carnegiea gigantea TaxID=171969 RepID=A0A9Q1KW63_9CARY|nr:hypothetical protein Cgig2_001343 [Carnegiea gigantea]
MVICRIPKETRIQCSQFGPLGTDSDNHDAMLYTINPSSPRLASINQSVIFFCTVGLMEIPRSQKCQQSGHEGHSGVHVCQNVDGVFPIPHPSARQRRLTTRVLLATIDRVQLDKFEQDKAHWDWFDGDKCHKRGYKEEEYVVEVGRQIKSINQSER